MSREPQASFLEKFQEQGFVVVEGVLDPGKDLQPIVEEYQDLLDKLARQLVGEGRLKSTYRNLPVCERLVRITQETGHLHTQPLDISLPQSDIAHDTPMHTGRAVFDLLRNPKLLDRVEAFIGPEIYSNPVQHTRFKLPKRVLPKGDWNGLADTVGWHQDRGVVLPEADESTILTVWIPVTEASEENGCLKVVPESNKHDLQIHCPVSRGGINIPGRLLRRRPVTVPMRPGSVLFMTRDTIHSSLPNQSDKVRWSFDLRYSPIGQPTGRPLYPGFVARSRSRPESVLTDPEVWSKLWRDARARLADQENPSYNRWSEDTPGCA